MLFLAVMMPFTMHAQTDNWTVIQKDTTVCDQYTWALNGQTYTATGVYTFVDNDTIYILNLTRGHHVDTTIATPLAMGCYYDWDTMHITQTGTYEQTFKTVENCDSTVHILVNITSTRNVTVTDTICGSYNNWGFSIVNTDTNAYLDTNAVRDTAIEGCNHHISVALHIAPVKYHPSPIDTLVYCDRYTLKLTNLENVGITITETTDTNTDAISRRAKYDTIFHPRTLEKCYDSTTFFHVVINKSSNVTESITNCGPLHIEIGGKPYDFTYSTSKEIQKVGGPNANAAGCDSNMTLHITIHPIPVVTISGNLSVNPNTDVTLTANSDQSNTVFAWNGNSANNAETYTIPNVTSNTDVSLTGTNPSTKCAYTTHVTILCNVGINEAEAANINVYPNPTVNAVTVESANNITTLTIYNAMGQQVYNQSNMGNKATLDLSRFNNGIYTMQMVMDNGTKGTRTIIVNK